MLVEYWDFISRALPLSEDPRGFDAIPDFYYLTILWSTVFTVLNLVVPFLARALVPKWYGALSDRDKREFPSYVVCLVHHLSMVPTAWVHVYSDSVLTAAEAAVVKYALVEAYVGPFCVGYLMGDTIAFAVPEAFRGRFEYLVHHVLTIWLIITAMFGPGNLCRYIPHLLLCDTTNIFFNSAWLLRRSGWKGTSLVSALEMSFALCFLLVRVINLPLIFLNALMQPCVVQWGAARFTLIPIAGMQWYWFYKIASTIISRLVPNPRKSKSG